MQSWLTNIGSTALFASLVLVILYRRFRRSFGLQPLRAKRMIVRSLLLTLVCALLLAAPYRSAEDYGAAALGALAGLALAWYAGRHTRLELTPAGGYYTPNGWIGLLVSALFIGRLLYRFAVVFPIFHRSLQQAARQPGVPVNPLSGYSRSPLTLGLYFLLAGYYVAYYLLLWWKANRMSRQDAQRSALSG